MVHMVMFIGLMPGFRQITEENNAISPDVENKIVIDIKQQTLSCYEGNSEVYFAVSTGAG